MLHIEIKCAVAALYLCSREEPQPFHATSLALSYHSFIQVHASDRSKFAHLGRSTTALHQCHTLQSPGFQLALTNPRVVEAKF